MIVTPLVFGLLLAGQMLDVGGSKIYYEECGAGSAVVLLHDGLVHAISWDGQWSDLCKTHHVVRYDRRGYGRSEAAPKDRFSPTEDLYVLMTHLKIPAAAIVGCSSGGGLAIDFALEHPEKVTSLVLIGPVLHGMRTTAHFSERGSKNSAPLEKGDFKGAAENWSKDRYLIAGDHAAARKILYDALVENPQNLRVNAREIRPTPAAVYRLSEITVPALIIVGESDIPDVLAYCGAIEAGILGARREVWRDAGHLVQLEKPRELTARIESFLGRFEKEVGVPAARLQSYTGKYDAGGFKLTVVLRNRQLILKVPGEADTPFYSESQTKFFAVPIDATIEFVEEGGKVIAMNLTQGGAVTRFGRE